MATIELTDGGRPQVGAQEVRHAHSSMVTRTRDKEGQGDTRQRTPSPKPQRQPSENPESSNRTGMTTLATSGILHAA